MSYVCEFLAQTNKKFTQIIGRETKLEEKKKKNEQTSIISLRLCVT